MKLSYEGIGQWAATFACDDLAEGELVKVSANGTVAACAHHHHRRATGSELRRHRLGNSHRYADSQPAGLLFYRRHRDRKSVV